MTTEQQESPPSPQEPAEPTAKRSRRWQNALRFVVFIAFVWALLGVSVIYGIRLWHDAPPDPSFMPIVWVSYSVLVSLIVVLTLEYIIGHVKFKLGTSFEFEGAASSIILWVLCFLAVGSSMALMVVKDVPTVENRQRLSVPYLLGISELPEQSDGGPDAQETANDSVPDSAK